MLTFDDGPSRVLPGILDILEKEKVPATFFWQSRLLHKQRPWQRVLAGGHQIGTHSWKHRDLSKLNYEVQYRDLAQSVAKIESIIGNKVVYFRPPFGQYNDDTVAAAQALNLVPVLWKVASMDWELKDSPEQIITNVINHVEDRSIILLHELPQTRDILPELIQEIKKRGYHFTNL